MRKILVYLVWFAALVLVTNVLTPWVSAQVPAFFFGSTTCANVTVPTGTEVALATSGPISTQGARTISLHGSALVSPGVGATSFTMRIHRGTAVTGVDVVTPTTAVTPTAPGTAGYTADGDDTPGEVANQQYTLGLQMGGASTTGKVNTCELWYVAH